MGNILGCQDIHVATDARREASMDALGSSNDRGEASGGAPYDEISQQVLKKPKPNSIYPAHTLVV